MTDSGEPRPEHCASASPPSTRPSCPSPRRSTSTPCSPRLVESARWLTGARYGSSSSSIRQARPPTFVLPRHARGALPGSSSHPKLPPNPPGRGVAPPRRRLVPGRCHWPGDEALVVDDPVAGAVTSRVVEQRAFERRGIGISTSDYGRDFRLGYGLGMLEPGGVNLELGVDAQRRESPLLAGTSDRISAGPRWTANVSTT